MADNVQANSGTGGAIFRTDEVSANVHVPYTKLMSGTDAATDVIPGDATNGLDVDVTRLPALPTGANTIGAVNLAQYTPATGRLPVDGSGVTQPVSGTVTANLAAGTNNIGDVDVLSVVPGTGATNLGKAEDAAHTTGDTGVMALGVRRDANTTLVGTDGDYAPFQLDANGSVKVAIISGAGSGGTSATDDAAFTVASGSGTPIMGLADETSPDSVDEGDVGVVRMTLARALHVNLRDASGNELTAGAQYAEDAAHASGDQLTMAGAVRRDTPASGVSADGDNAALGVDSNGRLWTNAGQVAHDAVVSGNPVHTGGVATSGELTAVASGDVVYSSHTLTGKQIVQPYSTRLNFWRYAAPAGGLVNTTGVTAKTAPGAGLRNCITGIQIINTHATISTEIEIRDGAAGSVMWRGWAQAGGGGVSAQFLVPLVSTNATLIEIAEVTATATTGVLVNMQGYVTAD